MDKYSEVYLIFASSDPEILFEFLIMTITALANSGVDKYRTQTLYDGTNNTR